MGERAAEQFTALAAWAKRVDERLAALEGWGTLKWSAERTADWDSLLIEDGSVTDTPGGMRFAVERSARRVRCEVQSHRPENAGCAIPAEQVYEWQLYVPAECTLSEARGDGYNTICQFHTDQPCYTGGVGLRAGTDELVLRVKGGETYSTAGSCEQEYEEQLVFGRIERDRWHTIRVHALWHPTAGFSVARLDGVLGAEVRDVPTCGDAATKQKFRLGWYAPDVPDHLDMTVRAVRVFAND